MIDRSHSSRRNTAQLSRRREGEYYLRQSLQGPVASENQPPNSCPAAVCNTIPANNNTGKLPTVTGPDLPILPVEPDQEPDSEVIKKEREELDREKKVLMVFFLVAGIVLLSLHLTNNYLGDSTAPSPVDYSKSTLRDFNVD